MVDAIYKTLPGCPGARPREYRDPICQNAAPVLYYDIPCAQAMCLFPISVYEASQVALRAALRSRPATNASAATKLDWCETVSETLGTMNWATNVRLLTNAEAAIYINAAYPLSAAKKEQQLGLLRTRINDARDRMPAELVYLKGLMRADFKGRTGHELDSTSSGTHYSGTVLFPTDAFDVDADRAAALAHYALPGRQLVPYESRSVLWKKCNTLRCKTKRALKKISPIQSAKPGSTTARVQIVWKYVPSADETIRIFSRAIEDALLRRYVSDIEAGYARWLRVYEAYFLAGVVGTDPAQLRAMSVELQRAKMAAGAQQAAALVSLMPVIGTIAATAMSLAAKALRDHGAIGTSKIMCPPAPFLRSVASEMCDTGTVLGTDPAATAAKFKLPVQFWASQASAQASSGQAPAAPAAAGTAMGVKIVGALALVGGAIYLLRRRT